MVNDNYIKYIFFTCNIKGEYIFFFIYNRNKIVDYTRFYGFDKSKM